MKYSILFTLLSISIVTANVIDTLATEATKALYKNLKELTDSSFLYGQHHVTAQGITIDGTGETTDCKSITGDHPAVYGFDLGQVSK